MEEIMNDKWISIDEAAEYLGIKTVTLRSWIRNGKEGLCGETGYLRNAG